MASAVPPQLEQAILQASKDYGLPPDLLGGIWRVESGGTYPNPAVNSSGYGGLFGTRDPYGPTLEQADLAASILETGLANFHGNISEALSYYNTGKPTGGYTSVPGETSFGIAKGYHSKKAGGGGVLGTVEAGINDIGGVFIPGYGNTPLPGIVSGIGGAASGVAGAVGHAVASPFESALGGVESALLRGVMILGGFLLALVGLYLIANSMGIAPGATQAAQMAVTKNPFGGAAKAERHYASRTYRRGATEGVKRDVVKHEVGAEPKGQGLRRKPAAGSPTSSQLGPGDSLPF